MAANEVGLGTGRTGGREATTGVIPGRFALSVGCPNTQPPSGWAWKALSSVAQLESGHTPSRKHPEYWGGGVPWIGIKDATENHGRVLYDTFQHVSKIGLQNSSARLLPANTVCLSRTASVGFVVVMGRPMATSQDFVNWVCGPSIDPHFLKYVLLAEKEALWRFASGTTHQTIYYPEAKAFHVCMPSIREQQAIVSMLGALDSKIELNRRMNATLEAMARSLFKSWFVDFDPVRANKEGRQLTGLDRLTAAQFPSSFKKSDAGEIPANWGTATLSDLADLQKGLSYKGDGLAVDGGLPMVNLGCFTGRGIFNADRIKRYTGEYRQRHLVRPGDLVIANTDMTQNRVIIGSPALVPEVEDQSELLFTHHVFAVRFKPGSEVWRRYVYFTLLQPRFREIAEGFSIGTTVLALPRDGLLRYRFCVPPVALLRAFERAVLPILSAVQTNNAQSRTLASLRDTLLPKLLSGELRIPDAMKTIENVA
jgi:type I restriction enzyme, S subunit